MTIEDKRLQCKINVVKKKMKRIQDQRKKLQTCVHVKENLERTAENKSTNPIWNWIKDKFW